MKSIVIVLKALLIVWIFLQSDCYGSVALKLGSSGDEVFILQKQLRDYEYYQGDIDGQFGEATRIAVEKFQFDRGLEDDGVVGLQTLEALRDFHRGSLSASRGQADRRKAYSVAVFAKRFLGVPYVWGGRSPGGFDCSGFVSYIFEQYGYKLPRMSDEMFEVGVAVARGELQLGDLVFFSTYEPGASHTGIYIGNDQFIHASSGAGEVTITPLSKTYYRERYYGARRIIAK